MKWNKLKLGSLVDIKTGKLDANASNINGKYPFFTCAVEPLKIDTYAFDCEAVLVAGNGDLNVKHYKGKFNAYQRTYVIQVKEANNLHSRYLFYFMESILNTLRNNSIGGVIKYIKLNNLTDASIPLPPLHIQKEIADTLDKADALRRKDQELIEKYNELGQAVFYEMFGDPVWNEKGWEIKSVIEMADCIVPGRDKPKSFTGKIPWITTEDLQHLNYTHKSKKGIGLTESEIKSARARKIPKNSILMTCVGDLGVVSLAGFEMVVNQQLHTFQCKSINPIFLMYALSLQKNYMIRMASSTTLPYMNKTICNSIPIIAPPLKMQEVFSNFIKNLNSQIEKIKIGLELSNNLMKTQTNRCFNGC